MHKLNENYLNQWDILATMLITLIRMKLKEYGKLLFS